MTRRVATNGEPGDIPVPEMGCPVIVAVELSKKTEEEASALIVDIDEEITGAVGFEDVSDDGWIGLAEPSDE